MYTAGELAIIDVWQGSSETIYEVYGTLLSELVEGNANLLDEFGEFIDEEWLDNLAKIIGKINDYEFIKEEDVNQD